MNKLHLRKASLGKAKNKDLEKDNKLWKLTDFTVKPKEGNWIIKCELEFDVLPNPEYYAVDSDTPQTEVRNIVLDNNSVLDEEETEVLHWLQSFNK